MGKKIARKRIASLTAKKESEKEKISPVAPMGG